MTSSYKIAFAAGTVLSVMLVGYYVVNRPKARADSASSGNQANTLVTRHSAASSNDSVQSPGGGTTSGQQDTPHTPDEPVAGTITLDGNTGKRNYREYIVQRGDTIASIAVAHYGSDRYWEDISQANPFVDMAALHKHVGKPIRLPDVQQQQPAGGITAPKQELIYTVKSGDKLWNIAHQYYSDPNAWRWIYNRNRNVIGPDSSKLKVGMKLVIPPAPPTSN